MFKITNAWIHLNKISSFQENVVNEQEISIIVEIKT